MVIGILRNRWVLGVLAGAVGLGTTFVGRHLWNERLLATAVVRLAHPDGRPAEGLRVEARWTRRGGGTGLRRLRSDAAGVLDLARIADDPHPALWGYRLQLQVPGGNGEWLPLAPKVDFAVPDLAAITVEVQDKDGRPWSLDQLKAELTWTGGEQTVPMPLGRAEFPIAVGSRVHVDVRLHAHLFQVDVEAPTRRGEHREVTLRLPADAVIANGRIVDEAGKPREGSVLVVVDMGRGNCVGGRFELRADGRFQAVCGQGLTAPLVLHFAGPAGWSGKRPVEALPADKEVQLGDVVLRPTLLPR